MTASQPIPGRLGALIGPARSGTTWAGTLVDSSPDVIYRFEPFRRMAPLNPRFRHWFDELKSGRFREADIPQLYADLRVAHPSTNKPPFFSRKAYGQRTFGRSALWPAARAIPMLARAYERTFTPSARAPVVFKEVTFINPLNTLLEHTAIPVAYIVRHPCATVMSEVKGQEEGMMPSGRQAHLGEILRRYVPSLADQFPDVVAGSDPVKRIALLWRCEIEVCVPAVVRSTRGLLLAYEKLATDTACETRRMLSHFGLEYTEQTQRYIDYLHGLGAGSRKRTGWGDKYFSVDRNPSHQHDEWKRRISTEDRIKIESIVSGSDAYGTCAMQGGWE